MNLIICVNFYLTGRNNCIEFLVGNKNETIFKSRRQGDLRVVLSLMENSQESDYGNLKNVHKTRRKLVVIFMASVQLWFVGSLEMDILCYVILEK